MSIKDNVRALLEEIPAGVKLLAAAKSRTPQEIIEAVDAGIHLIGENYLQDAEAACEAVGSGVEWHFIGHLQRNKVAKAVRLFDMIETVDSLELAAEIDRRCAQIDKVMPVLIEINSGREQQKAGVVPEQAEALIRNIAGLKNITIKGLMTMGPLFGDPEESRPYFVETRKVFAEMKKLALPGVEMRELSMGMTDSYKVAIEEGATVVRIGTLIFGQRHYH